MVRPEIHLQDRGGSSNPEDLHVCLLKFGSGVFTRALGFLQRKGHLLQKDKEKYVKLVESLLGDVFYNLDVCGTDLKVQLNYGRSNASPTRMSKFINHILFTFLVVLNKITKKIHVTYPILLLKLERKTHATLGIMVNI